MANQLEYFFFVVAVYTEQPNRGQKHAATEPPVSLRPATGPDCYENRGPTGRHGKIEGRTIRLGPRMGGFHN